MVIASSGPPSESTSTLRLREIPNPVGGFSDGPNVGAFITYGKQTILTWLIFPIRQQIVQLILEKKIAQ